MYFGVDNLIDESHGPFYCGMSVVLNIPQFAIRLNGPTSTSLHIEVAMRFGGTEGMIIQLNNEGLYAQLERHFDCEWLSAFPEESERLFMGGRYMLQLETVRIVETKNNYCRFLRAFHLFDCMLSGDWPRPSTKAKKEDIRILSGAVSGYLGIKSNDYHPFINDTFRHFCARKTQVVLSFEEMDDWIQNEAFVSLIMNPVKEQKYQEISDNDTNLIKPVLFELFRNVHELAMHTTAEEEDVDSDEDSDEEERITAARNAGMDSIPPREYSFNISRFAECVLRSASLKRLVINDEHSSWFEAALSDSIKQRLIGRGWNITSTGKATIITKP